MNPTAAAVARLLDDDGRCPPTDPPGGAWFRFGRVVHWWPTGWVLSGEHHRHVPSTSGRGATSPRRPAPGTAP